MVKVKRSISIPVEIAREAEEAAREDGVSFSAIVNEAGREFLLEREKQRVIREWEAQTRGLPLEERIEGRFQLYQRLYPVDAE